MMSPDTDLYDLFVSYAREDNRDGWISRFVEVLLAEHKRSSGGPPLTSFFDEHEIRSMDDWRLRICDSLAQSRLLLAFISPTYFTRPWCRREWRTWIDHEIAKHVLSQGVMPLIVVEVPDLTSDVDERQVAETVAQLCKLTPPYEQFCEEVAPTIKQLRRRMFVSLTSHFEAGASAFDHLELQQQLTIIANRLTERTELVRRAEDSVSAVPPYNRRFSGRLSELMQLREWLRDDRGGVMVGIHGLGGVGKTELAFTFSHAFASEYPGGRFLIPCEGMTDLRDAVLRSRLAAHFRDRISDEERKSKESYFAAVAECLRERLRQKGRALLVLDNVTGLQMLAPQETDHVTGLGANLHLLATAREVPKQDSFVRWLPLGELPEEDALELLEKHRPFANEAERDSSRMIVRRLDGFAIAVEVVAAWLAANPTVTPSEFLDRMGLEELETVDASADDATLRRHNHERRLKAVLGPTLAMLTPTEGRAMEYAALLAPDFVPLVWLRALTSRDFPEMTDNRWAKVCQTLSRLALTMRGEGEGGDARLVRVHRLVQSLIRSEFSTEATNERQRDVEELAKARVKMLEKTVRWQEARWEVEPLDGLANLWGDNGHEDAPWLLSKTGGFWRRLAQWPRAELLVRRALAIDEQAFGNEHPNVARDLSNLAVLLQATDRLREAEAPMRRALAIDEKSFGDEHPDIAKSLNNLAALLKETNRLSEAEPFMRRALAINEKFLGNDDPEVATILNNLAQLLQATNRPADAEPLLRRALAIYEQSDGAEHPNVATCLNNLSRLLQATNRLSEAEPLMRRALAIDERAFGSEHPNIASRLNNLATLLQTTNRPTDAEPLLRRALAIDEQAHGTDHPSVAVCLNNLARLMQDMNRLCEAEPLIRRALAINTRSFGNDHPEVARNLNNLGTLLKETNRLSEAELMIRRALAINEQSLGDDHPEVATNLSNLAQLLQATNRLSEAERLLRRALAIDEQAYGNEHPDVARDINNLGWLLKERNRLSEAEPLMRRALAIEMKSFGSEHPNVAIRLNNLALLLHDTNRMKEAEEMMRRAIGICTDSLGDEHPNTIAFLENYDLLFG